MNRHAQAARDCATYFQIPLCAFAYGKTERERLEAIISYGIVAAGAKRWGCLSESQRSEELDDAIARDGPPAEFKKMFESHRQAVIGTRVTNTTIGNVASCCERHRALASFIRSFEARHGRDALVRLRTDLVFDARDGKGITSRELSVLAAIFSIIGRQQDPVLITQQRIRQRALGYKTAAVMAIELPKRTDGLKPLSDWQLRTLLDRLQAHKFFARTTFGRRLSYYSHRMTEAALRARLAEIKTHQFATKCIRSIDDENMSHLIRNQRAELLGQRLPAPEASPFPLPSLPRMEDVT